MQSKLNKTEWKVALYMRISEQETDSEKNSIHNQIEILKSLAFKKDLRISKKYIDNGITGGNFDRPAFNDMIQDIQEGRINCVMVKDLSRFGREHIDANYFIEKLFPRFGVRIITSIEGFDSFENKNRMNGMEVPLINLFNDQYLQQVSTSTKASLKVKMKEGKFIGTKEPYGYLRSKEDKHRLVVDHSVSEHVKNIFKWYIQGASLAGIAKRLNALNIDSPSVWRAKLYKRDAKTRNWQSNYIMTILKNEVYIGDMVQGKTTSPSRKVRTRIDVPKDQWVVVKNTHEPIINRKDFFIVQELLKIKAKPKGTHLSVNQTSIFAGMVYCDECGKRLKRKIKRDARPPYDMRYLCSTYLALGKKMCSSHYILEKDIEFSVAQEINKLISDLKKAVSGTQDKAKRRKLLKSMQFKIDRLKDDLDNTKKLKNELYVDLKRQIINEDEFCDLKRMFDKRIIKIEKEQTSFENELNRLRNGNSVDPVIRAILSYDGFNCLTRGMLVELIDRIVVDNNRSIKVYFKNMKEANKYL